MTTSETFRQFLENLAIDNAEVISLRYEEITACLNKKFRDTDSKTANSLQVGSYGRSTAIKGISDLDMIYIMPQSKWETYKSSHSKLLTDTKDAIKARYPSTEVYVDRLVVRVLYKDFHIEVMPAFEEDDGSFKYADTYNGGSWKITKPREEIEATKEVDDAKNKNLRRLCKMARAWKNKHGVGIGGLLIDTLCHNFLKSSSVYDNKSFDYYDEMNRDFFKYMADEEDKDFYAALGSGQRVRVKARFQKKAQKAYELSLKAIAAKDEEKSKRHWRKIFGRPFTTGEKVKKSESSLTGRGWKDTEEFIEDKYPIDIRYWISLDCEVSQNGFRTNFLTEMLKRHIPLLASKSLMFKVSSSNVPEPYDLEWKVLNRGEEAERRDKIRGQILRDDGHRRRKETTNFRGEHIVECYAIRNGVVVAKDRILVPIQSNENSTEAD